MSEVPEEVDASVATRSDELGADVVDLDDRVGPVEITPTGDERVDAVLAQLHALDSTAVATHVAVLEQVHAGLRSVLDSSTAG